jgi:GT2 family glycosyltransferase
MTGPQDDVSVVIPSHNRADALRRNLPVALEMDEVREVVVVVERHTSDDSEAVVAGIGDERLRLIRNPGAPGLSASRNAGVNDSSGAWILFGEDDCRFPRDYASVLKREAHAHDAQIAGAPWLHLEPDRDPEEELARLRAGSTAEPGIDRHGLVPAATVETPFVPAPALIRRDVLDRVRFDEGYTGNAWRQETAFFVEAVRAGYRCVLTPYTASYQIEQWSEGGSRAPRLRYELDTLRNNWRFLRLHGDWLVEQGHVPSKLGFQASFAGQRLADHTRGFLLARLRRRPA